MIRKYFIGILENFFFILIFIRNFLRKKLILLAIKIKIYKNSIDIIVIVS